MGMTTKGALTTLGIASVLSGLMGCGPNEQKRAELTELKRIECLDKFCTGDVEPPHDLVKEVALKLNGQWFIGPSEYFSSGRSGAVFYWPGMSPGFAPGDFPPGVKGKDFSEVAIEIFIRSNNLPSEPTGYKFIALAEANSWIESRTTLRPGLDAITMKHVIGPDGYHIDHVTYYVATQLKGPDGLPPVAGCNHKAADNSGGTGFMWQPGIAVDTRMNQKHCADWPEIFQEITRVLQLLKKA